MHELSLALSILDVVKIECEKSGYSKIESITVKIGKASGVFPDALLFAFDAIKSTSLASHALMNVEQIPLGGTCKSCSLSFTVDERYVLSCPECGSTSFSITQGRELEIVEMEVS